MAKSVDKQIWEVDAFVASLSRTAIPDMSPVRETYKLAYRDFHCILIWQAAIESSSGLGQLTKIHLNEVASDLSQSLLCTLIDLYKPARVMIRSAIENCMRVIVGAAGGNPSISIVYNLASEFMKSPVSEGVANPAANTMLRLYDELCKYVHSSTPMHMDLRIPFNDISTRNDSELKACLKLVGEFSRALNQLLFAQCYAVLSTMHHVNADWIRDRIPPALKRQVSTRHS